MSNINKRKSGAILSYISIFVSMIIQIVYPPILIRMLGQSEYGLYSLVNSIIGYLTILDFGFGNAIIVYTSKYRAIGDKESEERLHGMFKMVFYIISFIAILLGIVPYFNTELFFENTMNDIELRKAKIMMLILTFNLGITFAFSIYSSIITAYEEFTFQKIISIVTSCLKPIIMIPLLYLGLKSITMVMVITLVNVGVIISNYVFCKKKLKIKIKYKGFDKALFKTIFGYSIWIFLGIIVDKINWSADQFILGAVSGTIAVSIYSIASTLNQLFLNLSTAISGVFLPKISTLVATNASSTELTEEFIKVGRIQYYIIFLACSGLVLFGKKFISIWAGEGFEESYYVSLLLIIPLCIPLIQNLGLSIMQAMNKYRFKSITTAIMAFFNIIISIILAKKYDAIGAAAGTAIALIICNGILINYYYYKEIKLNIFNFWKNILKMTTFFIIPIILIVLIMNIINFSWEFDFIIYAIIYTAVFFFVAYKFVMNEFEINIIKGFLKKIKRNNKCYDKN